MGGKQKEFLIQFKPESKGPRLWARKIWKEIQSPRFDTIFPSSSAVWTAGRLWQGWLMFFSKEVISARLLCSSILKSHTYNTLIAYKGKLNSSSSIFYPF